MVDLSIKHRRRQRSGNCMFVYGYYGAHHDYTNSNTRLFVSSSGLYSRDHNNITIFRGDHNSLFGSSKFQKIATSKCTSMNYQGKGFPSYCKNVPLLDSFNATTVFSIVLQLVSISNGACLPPMSVLTHPGCMLTHNILETLKSMLIDLVAAFNADCGLRIEDC